ncbi:MAG: hypothetical protein ACRCVN_03595 [Spirochaetia bacterium]
MSQFDSVDQFFRKHHLHSEQIDLAQHVQRFTQHMHAGLAHQGQSLAMLPTYIGLNSQVLRNEKVVVMDAGGTNFRAALVYFDKEGKPVIEKFRKGKMPGTEKPLTQDQFFDEFATHIADLCQESSKIGFCFSYPAQAMPNHDGELIFFTKGIQVKDSNGMLIGEGLKKALKRRGMNKDHNIVIVNDTVTTLLTGLVATPEKEFDGCIGVILGTGTNVAYAELNEKIIKIPGQLTGARHIINIESGNFDAHDRGDIDNNFIKNTLPYGQQALEKAISGAYLGPLTHAVILAMAEEGIFVSQNQIKNIPHLSTIELGEFLHTPENWPILWNGVLKDVPATDIDLLYRACELIVDRAAKFFAMKIVAILLQSGHGLCARRPARIVIDGTTFYATKGLKEATLCYIKQSLAAKDHRYYEIVEVEDASLLGAAVAALTCFDF